MTSIAASSLQQYRTQPEDVAVRLGGTSWDTMEPNSRSTFSGLLCRRQQLNPYQFGVFEAKGSLSVHEALSNQAKTWVS